MGSGFMWLRKGNNEHGYEPSGSIKRGEFLDQMSWSRRTLPHGVREIT